MNVRSMGKRTWVCGMACAAMALVAITGFRAQSPQSGELSYLLVDIDRIGYEAVQALKTRPEVRWWVEADDKLLTLAEPGLATKLTRPVTILKTEPRLDRLFVVRKAHDRLLAALDVDLLVRGGRTALIQANDPIPDLELKDKEAGDGHRHEKIHLFRPNSVFARQAANGPTRTDVDFPAKTQDLVTQVDGARWLADVETLAGWNRYTHGTGIAEARQWLFDRFSELPGMEVRLEPFQVGSTTAYNVVAKLTGTVRPDEWYVVGGHYDSISQSPSRTAPGAEDNATGAAGVLEMARVFAANPPEASIFFIAYAGEEQGLHGSTANARGLVDRGEDERVQGAFIMDMIGFTQDDDLDCLLESDRTGEPMFEVLQSAASRFTRLRIVTTLNPWGSDHVPYLNRDMPATLTIENDWNQYPDYHRTGDVATNVSLEMGEETLKMNVAALARMAGPGSHAMVDQR